MQPKTVRDTPLQITYMHILGQKNEDCAAHHGVASLFHAHWHLETLGRE